MAVVNLGHGVGGGLSIRGWPQRGVSQEIGHISIPGNKRKCRCGKKGCVETLLSWQSISEELSLQSPEEFSKAVQKGDEEAEQAYLLARQTLQFLLQTLTITLAPEVIAISGGFFWGFWEQHLDSLEADLNQTVESGTDKGIDLLGIPGPETSLEGLYDLPTNFVDPGSSA